MQIFPGERIRRPTAEPGVDLKTTILSIMSRNLRLLKRFVKSHFQEVLITHPLPIPLFPKSYFLPSQAYNINRLFSTKFLVLGIYNGSLIISKF